MSTLLVVRTPFQAWLAQKVLKKEQIKSLDVVYFTHNDSEEDRYYYEQLSLVSEKSEYIYIRPQRFDILSQMILLLRVRGYSSRNYHTVIYASINALVPNFLINKQKKAKLITFDDGLANIVNNGIFFNKASGRYNLYRVLIGSPTLKAIKKRITRHYTIYAKNKNIVENERLFFLEGWGNIINNKSDDIKTYFIGTPFEEVMNAAQILRLEDFVKTQDIDVYVAHPRERNMLDIGVPILSKHGRIAEDAIIADAGNKRIRLVGWFSSVMLNLESVCDSRIVLLPKDCVRSNDFYELSKKSGCTPILI